LRAASKPPTAHGDFVRRYPGIGEAWDLVSRSAEAGPLDPRTARLVKLGIAIGALREGAVHSSVRKARAAGASDAEMQQVLALAATTIGFPATVAAFTWVREESRTRKRHRRG